MLNGNLLSEKPQTVEPRHWSTEQSYVTGDVVAVMVGEGWGVQSLKEIVSEGRARMYLCVLERDGASMAVRVLDGPFVRSLAQNHFLRRDRAGLTTAPVFLRPDPSPFAPPHNARHSPENQTCAKVISGMRPPGESL